MSNKSSENYLDNLLDSVLDVEPEKKKIPEEKEAPDFEILSKLEEDTGESDDDFLRSFEAELEADSYKNYFADFEMELQEEQQHEVMFDPQGNGYGDNLESLLKDIEASSMDIDTIPSMPEPSRDTPEDLIPKQEPVMEEIDELTPEEILSMSSYEDKSSNAVDEKEKIPQETVSREPKVDDELPETASDIEEDLKKDTLNSIPEELPLSPEGEVDLSGMGDEDLLDMLAKSGEFEDIGEILSDDESGNSVSDVDEIGAFAQKEMEAQEAELEAEEEEAKGKKKKKGKKEKKEKKAKEAKEKGEDGGFFGRLKKLLFGEDEDDVEVNTIDPMGDPSSIVGELSEENQMILQELEGEESAKDKKGKKEKKKKEKKEKPPKEKKPKKEKPPKPPKEKKPKKEKVKDNTPPLPKKPVILIVIMVASMMAFVMIGTNLLSYSANISQAEAAYEAMDFTESYQILSGLALEEKDQAMYDQLTVLAPIASEYEAYKTFHEFNREDMALDSLVSALGRCEVNYASATELGCVTEIDALMQEISEVLRSTYGVEASEALEWYHLKDRRDYTYAIYKKIHELGLE